MANARPIVSELLGIENSASWSIVSENPEKNLYMVHHRPEANLALYGNVRGVVVDTAARAIVCQSYGFTPTSIADSLSLEEDGNLHLIDDEGFEHTIDSRHMKINMGHEGTLIHVFKHAGEVYRSTRKRLDPSRSKWGNSKTFSQMYLDLDGPSDEVLFDSKSDYSPYCHIFIIVHPDVLLVSKNAVGEGYLVYLGAREMWSVEYDDCPYKQVQSDDSLYSCVTQEEFDMDPRPNAGWIDATLHSPDINCPAQLTIEQANYALKFGFYQPFPGYEFYDQRLLPGEFVIVHQLDENGISERMFKVESTSYAWRSTLRDNNPNLLHRFYQLLTDTYSYSDSFNDMYPLLFPYDHKTISENLPLIVWPQDPFYNNPQVLKTRESRFYNVWISYLMAVPLHRQFEVQNYFNSLINSRNELVGWLRKLEDSNIDRTDFSKRVLNIIDAARRFSQNNLRSGKNFDRRGRKKSVKDMTRDNIRNFIMKEEGTSLYRLVKEMGRWKEQQRLERENSEQVVAV